MLARKHSERLMSTTMTRRGDTEIEPIDEPCCYVVSDIETDGPEPGRNSMRSFASVALACDGEVLGTIEGRLEPHPPKLSSLGSTCSIWRTTASAPRAPATSPASPP